MGRWEATPLYRGGSGEPLVVLHGGGATWRLWKPAIEFLEPHFEVLAPTLPGHWGGPELPPGPLASPQVLVDAVERTLDDAGVATAHVAGGSLGGWLALELGRRGRARTVVAIAPAGGHRIGGFAQRLLVWEYVTMQRLASLLARRPERWTRSATMRKLLLWHHFGHPERLEPDETAHLLVGLTQCAPFRDLAAAMRDYDVVAGLSDIRCPVLLAFPQTDWVLPRRFHGRRFVEALPDAEVIELPGVGHAAMADDPRLVATTIQDFVARRARRPVAA